MPHDQLSAELSHAAPPAQKSEQPADGDVSPPRKRKRRRRKPAAPTQSAEQ
jgi:hypothetical protein